MEYVRGILVVLQGNVLVEMGEGAGERKIDLMPKTPVMWKRR